MELQSISDNLKLFNQYTTDYRAKDSSRYKDFSNYSPYEIASITKYIDNYCWEGNREELCATLNKYASEIDASKESKDNIEKLLDSNTVAVVSGHQPSLFGGPLFVFLKIASVISLTRRLNSLGLQKKFVPVFWVASEDHNFAEYNTVSIFDKLYDIFNHSVEGDFDKKMASFRPSVTNKLIDNFLQSLPQTEFVAEIENEILGAKADNLGTFFSKLINKWFGRYGLITIEPNYLRELSKPLMIEAIKSHNKLVENMNLDSNEMKESGYNLQLPDAKLENTFLFYIENGVRHRIKYIGQKFIIEELNLSFTEDELVREIENNSSSFSPVAGLRPIIQGRIFPAVIYIAGGGELAYHVQLRRNFNELNVSVPLIIPRATGTFLTPSMNKLLKKFSISTDQILTKDFDWEVIKIKLISANKELEAEFASYNFQFGELNTNFYNKLATLGVNNHNEIKKEIDKFASRIINQQNKLAQNSSPIGNDAKNKFFRLHKFILPANKYQELTISSLYFYSLLGREFFDTICELDILTNNHKVWIFK